MRPEHRARCIGGLMQSGMGKAQAEKLLDAGLWPVKKLRAMSDEKLLVVEGVGQATVDKVRAWVGR